MGLMMSLRIKTAEDHARVENSMPIMQDSFGIAKYSSILQGILGFQLCLEQQLRISNSDFLRQISWQSRQKVQLLKEDLNYLSEHYLLSTDLVRESKFEVGSICAEIGYLYVSEGSTLGGQLISKHLCNSFGKDAFNITRYFRGYERETQSRWREFSDCVDTWDLSYQQQKETIEYAKNAFSEFEKATCRTPFS